MPKKIVIRCIEQCEYHISGKDIRSWDFDYNDEVIRIDHKDGSFIEFQKKNVIFVKFVSDNQGG